MKIFKLLYILLFWKSNSFAVCSNICFFLRCFRHWNNLLKYFLTLKSNILQWYLKWENNLRSFFQCQVRTEPLIDFKGKCLYSYNGASHDFLQYDISFSWWWYFYIQYRKKLILRLNFEIQTLLIKEFTVKNGLFTLFLSYSDWIS